MEEIHQGYDDVAGDLARENDKHYIANFDVSFFDACRALENDARTRMVPEKEIDKETEQKTEEEIEKKAKHKREKGTNGKGDGTKNLNSR